MFFSTRFVNNKKKNSCPQYRTYQVFLPFHWKVQIPSLRWKIQNPPAKFWDIHRNFSGRSNIFDLLFKRLRKKQQGKSLKYTIYLSIGWSTPKCVPFNDPCDLPRKKILTSPVTKNTKTGNQTLGGWILLLGTQALCFSFRGLPKIRCCLTSKMTSTFFFQPFKKFFYQQIQQISLSAKTDSIESWRFGVYHDPSRGKGNRNFF